MSRSANQKLKLVYLMKIFLEKTDDTHSITMPEIINSLKAYDITAERKSIYNDIECLKLYGIDIIGEQGEKGYHYYVGNRQFELPELKLLVDSVSAAKFISEKKSRELIKKIEGFASKYEASKLQRQVFMTGRLKTMNENIYYNVDAIHQAIEDNIKISFRYFSWNEKKKEEYRRNGERYIVSPLGLCCVDENYYMIAYDSESHINKHFRVDKMKDIGFETEKRNITKENEKFDVAVYSSKMFGMFDGEEIMVRMKCENILANVMIDRFGKDVMMRRLDDEHFEISVKVCVSRQFVFWVMSLGSGVKIVAPDSIIEFVKDEIRRLSSQYFTEE